MMNKKQLKSWGKVIWNAVQEYTQYGGSNMAAALAFYAVFSLAPLLVVVVAVVGFFFGDEAARGEVFMSLRGLLGAETAKFAEGMVVAANQEESKGVLASVIGLGTLLYGSSKVFNALRSGLNVIWQAPPQEDADIWNTVRDYGLSLALVPGFGVLFLVMMLSSTVISAFGKVFSVWADIPPFVPKTVDTVLSWFFISLMFAVLFRVLPDVKLGWRDVLMGSSITAGLFVVGKVGIAMYLSMSSTGSVFGAAGTLAVLLMWFFLSAQIFFFGAAFTHQLYLKRHNHEPEPEHIPPHDEDTSDEDPSMTASDIAHQA